METGAQGRPEDQGGAPGAEAVRRIANAARVRRLALADRGDGEPEGAARIRLNQAIAALRARIVLALSEAADVLADTDLALRLDEQERPLAAAALFRMCAVNADGEAAFVDLAVEARGRVHAVCEVDGRRETLSHMPLGEADRPVLLRWIADLLERFV